MKTTGKLTFSTSLSPEQRTGRILLAAGLFSCVLILLFVKPAALPFPSCAFHSITGHSCFTCGMTRSLYAISHGDLSGSFRYHLFGPASFLGMLLALIIFAAEAVRGKKLVPCCSRRMRTRAFILFSAAWIIYWGVRLAVECAA